MHLHEVEQQNLLIMKCIAGSHMYGTNTPSSDEDIRGIFIVPSKSWLDMSSPIYEVSDNKQDKKYYELRRFFELLKNANPSLLELLYIPEDCLLYKHPVYEELIKNRDIFITKKCQFSYCGYAYAQIKRAKGKNKKINRVNEFVNEQGLEQLKILLLKNLISKEYIQKYFCKDFLKYFERKFNLENFKSNKIIFSDMDMKCLIESNTEIGYMKKPEKEDYVYEISNCPVKVNKHILKTVDCSSVKHLTNVYRIYKNGKGFFRNGQLVLENISKEREITDFLKLVYYNEQAYEKALSEYRSFWEWMANRNDSRWVNQENKLLDYDAKNMCHTIRLLLEAENIAKYGRPKVRFEGNELKFLKDIREGKLEYEYLLKYAEEKEKNIKKLFNNSNLPKTVDFNKMNELYKKLNILFEES